MTLEPYEIAVLLQMYDERVIGHAGYTSLQKVRNKVKWQKIASHYKIKESFDALARRLVKRRLLSDDGKSLEVLFLDKLGVSFVVGYLTENPNAMIDLSNILK
jgi:hypothetical protein